MYLICKQHKQFWETNRELRRRTRNPVPDESGEYVYNYPGPPKAFNQKRIVGINTELPEYKEPDVSIVDLKTGQVLMDARDLVEKSKTRLDI